VPASRDDRLDQMLGFERVHAGQKGEVIVVFRKRQTNPSVPAMNLMMK
jgi:hypothetical protein